MSEIYALITGDADPGAAVEMAASGIRWDPSISRYRDRQTGRVVDESVARRQAEDLNQRFYRANMERLTDQLITGQIDLSTWQARMRQEIKDGHITNLTVGRGGRQQVEFSDWGRVGQRLQMQYRFLDVFAQEIASGTLTEAQIRARAAMYSTAARTAYFDGMTAAGQAAAHTEERRVLNPAEHCPDCLGYAAQGWVPIGTLPKPGQGSQCLSNCKCEYETR